MSAPSPRAGTHAAGKPPGVSPWKLSWGVALATFVLEVWLFRPLLAAYYPTLDEIAVQAASTGLGGPLHPVGWVTQGLHNYFVPYPEWSDSATDFWRPLVNGWYWCNHQIFGAYWSGQLMLGYLAHALVVGLTCYFALAILGLDGLAAGAAIALATLNPAYVFQSLNDPFSIPRALQFPIYQIEVIAALLMLLAVLSFIRRRYLMFGVIATCAVLFKETALALPVAALVLAAAARRPGLPSHAPRSTGAAAVLTDKRASQDPRWLALPLVVWVVGRSVAMLAGASRLLPAIPLKSWLSKPVRNLLLWPTGLHWQSLSATRGALRTHDWPTLVIHAGTLLINLGWWLALMATLVAAYRLWNSRRGEAVEDPRFAALVFALSNLLWVLLLPASELRYGYFWFALGPAAMFAFMSRWRIGSMLAALLSLCLLVPQCYSLKQSLSAAPLEAYRISKQSAKQLVSLLGELPPQVKTVYLVDDLVVQSSSPQFLARFAGFPGTVVLVNNLAPILGCAGGDASAPRQHLTHAPGVTTLEYEAPRCYERAWNVAPLDLFDSGRYIQRGKWMSYHFPELTVLTPWPNVERFSYDPGRHWSLRSKDPDCESEGQCAWLGFDPTRRAYGVLPSDVAQ